MGLLWAKRESKIEKQHLITYGKATFSLKQKDYQEIQRMNENNFQILFNYVWSLQYLEFQKGEWSKCIKRMIESSVQVLALFRSGSTQIIKEIEHIKFTNLQILSLGQNKIQSIQGLAFLDIETLKTLRLNENFITSIQPLIKLKLSNLKVLILSNNQIVEFDKMNRIKFNSKEQGPESKSKIWIDLRLERQEKTYANKKMGVDIGFLMKVQLKSIDHLKRGNTEIRVEHQHILIKRNNGKININIA